LIALITEIPRFYYSAVKELEERGIEFLSLGLREKIPPEVKVVLTTENEKEKIGFKNVVAGPNISVAIDQCLRILEGRGEEYEKLRIGIDPGSKPGMAVIGDGKVILTKRLCSPEEVLDAAQKIFAIYKGKEIAFRIGIGGGAYRARIAGILRKNFSFPIEIVEERTPLMMNEWPDDIKAAINIAIKRGRSLEIYPKPGEIMNLQKESRLLSGVTISRKLAEKVARGEMSMKEAIEAQKKRKI
jgi:hypothetical protein